MDIGFNLILGTASILYGLYTLVVRQVAPDKLSKLTDMKQRLGDKTGAKIHIVGYTVVPLVAGALILVAHFRGA